MLTGNLEYIVSSLPSLSFSNSEALQREVSSLFQKYTLTDKASVSLISILNEEASKFLSPRKFQKFRSINFNAIHRHVFQTSNTPVVAEFSKFMYQLKSELKHYRMTQKSDVPSTHITYGLLGELSANPLVAEQQLLKLQWEKLEALSIGHYSDVSALILYKLKLELLVRWWCFDTETGFEVFQQTLNKV